MKKKRENWKKGKLQELLLRAGFEIDALSVRKYVFRLSVFIVFILSFFAMFVAIQRSYTLFYLGLIIAVIWSLVFCALYLIVWIIILFALDFIKFRRRLSVELVLPDFLQLTAANIRAGMLPDRALWSAVRPRFGILSHEIEIVAKETMSGESLANALRKFSEKYDSLLLKRSMNLLVEGIEAGGELGEILAKVSHNIQEARILEKEMAANVTTYAIFITVAALFAAPVLFAFANQLLNTLGSLTSNLNITPQVGALQFFSLSGDAISSADFKLFSYIMLTVTSFFSAAIVAIIKNGTIKAGIRYIPVFIATALFMFISATTILNTAFGSFF